MAVLRLIVLAAALVSATSCTVDRSGLDRVFFCERSSDCGPNYRCYRALAEFIEPPGGFCVPACGEDCADCRCDGYCTARGECLSTCDPRAPDCGEGRACLRLSIEERGVFHSSPRGICAPVATCDDSSDCGEERPICLSDMLLDHDAVMDNTLCLAPRCGDDGACPEGWQCVEQTLFAPGEPRCWPRCGDDQQCPPGMTCAVTLGLNVCLPGVPVSFDCDDDVNCLVGRCRDFGLASFCTVDCADSLECASLPFDYMYTIPELMECRDDGAGPLCTVSRLGRYCDGDDDCTAGLDCLALHPVWDRDDDSTIMACSLDCTRDGQCESFGGYCSIRATDRLVEGRCVRFGRVGAPCELATAGRRCVEPLTCVAHDGLLNPVCSRACDGHAECRDAMGLCLDVPEAETPACIPVGGPGDLCFDNDQQPTCWPGLECFRARFATDSGVTEAEVCSRICSRDDECLDLGAYCASDEVFGPAAEAHPGLCHRRRPDGVSCDRDDQCLGGACESGSCASPIESR